MNPDFLKSTYSFHLPEELIASQPLHKRDESRLMVVHRATRTFEHRKVSDLPEYLNAGDAIVANNTRVFRARLLGERVGTGGKVEFFLLKALDGNSAHALVWQGLMKSGAKITPGFRFKIPGSQVFGEIEGEVLGREDTPSGATFTAKFNHPPLQAEVGEVPLPPYIMAKRHDENREGRSAEQELQTYNTVFAENDGSVAAPTAGRHFTSELIGELKAKGISWNEITLHVGLGTFKPVTTDDIRDHLMHAEPATISEATAQVVRETKKTQHRVLTIGTTTTRALEGSVNAAGEVMAGQRDVNIFIHPSSSHLWRVSDAILTNFHLPESTLLMMISSFLEQGQVPGAVNGTAWLLELYQEAIRQKYRFYSYGDAMLIL